MKMTQKRWEEIKRRVATFPPSQKKTSNSHAMLHELVAWLETQDIELSPDEPEYEPHDIVSMAEEIKRRDTGRGVEGREIVYQHVKPGHEYDEVMIPRFIGIDGVRFEAEQRLDFRDYRQIADRATWLSDGTPVARKKT